MKNNSITLFGLNKIACKPEILGRAVTLALELTKCCDYSHRCEPAELFINENGIDDNATIYFRECGSNIVKKYEMVCSRYELMNDIRFEEYVKSLNVYFNGEIDVRNCGVDDIFLSGICNKLIEHIDTYEI